MQHSATRGGIYSITNEVNGCQYIGSAVTFRHRWNRHKHELRRGQHGNEVLQRAWAKYGEAAFRFEKIIVCAPAHLLLYEQRCIDGLNPTYNICRVAGSGFGTKRSAETKRKIAASRVGLKLGPMSDEHKRNISEGLKGVKRSPEFLEMLRTREYSDEHRARISAALKGRPLTDEHREKLSAAKKGRTMDPRHVEKCAAGNRGKKRTPEILERMSLAQKGRQFTPEHRAAISAGHARRRALRNGEGNGS